MIPHASKYSSLSTVCIVPFYTVLCGAPRCDSVLFLLSGLRQPLFITVNTPGVLPYSLTLFRCELQHYSTSTQKVRKEGRECDLQGEPSSICTQLCRSDQRKPEDSRVVRISLWASVVVRVCTPANSFVQGLPVGLRPTPAALAPRPGVAEASLGLNPSQSPLVPSSTLDQTHIAP